MNNRKDVSSNQAQETNFALDSFEKAQISEELQEKANGKYRNLTGFPRYLAFGIAVATTLIVFYTAFAGVFLPMIQRGILICSMLALTFLWYPTSKKSNFDRNKVPFYDWIMVAMCFVSLYWTISNNSRCAGPQTRIHCAATVSGLKIVYTANLTSNKGGYPRDLPHNYAYTIE